MATLTFGYGPSADFREYFTAEIDTRGMGAVAMSDACLAQARLHVADVTSVTVTKQALAGKNGRVYVHVAAPDKPKADKPSQAGKQAPAGKAQAPVGLSAEAEATMLVEYGVAPDMPAALAMVQAKRDARKARIAELQDAVTQYEARIAELQAQMDKAQGDLEDALNTIAHLAIKA